MADLTAVMDGDVRVVSGPRGTARVVPPRYATDADDKYKYKYLIAIAVTLASLLELIDTSIVNVAIPHMMGNLGATLDEISWVSTGYTFYRQCDRDPDVGVVVGVLWAQAISHGIDRDIRHLIVHVRCGAIA